MTDLKTMFGRLKSAPGQTRTCKTIEVFGWLLLVESTLMLLRPRLALSVLRLGDLDASAASFFRIVALLVGGLGMLYVVSGRLNSEGFAFASILDRPLVVPVMAVLWSLGLMPVTLALAFGTQDFLGALWTFLTWRADASPAR